MNKQKKRTKPEKNIYIYIFYETFQNKKITITLSQFLNNNLLQKLFQDGIGTNMAAKQKCCCQFLQNCQGWLSTLNPF